MSNLTKLITLRRRPLAFDSARLVEPEKLGELKKLCLRAPSSFNAQPFRCILVQRDDVREELAHCMIGTRNARNVTQAPVTAVFLADRESFKVSKPFREEQTPGLTYQQRKRTHENQAFISGYHGGAVRKVTQSLSSLAPTQHPEDATVWAVKQTCFFADHWILASSGLGLSTWAMEGFDEMRVRQILGASDRFYCPVVIATGYSKDLDADQNQPESPRLDPDEVFVNDRLS